MGWFFCEPAPFGLATGLTKEFDFYVMTTATSTHTSDKSENFAALFEESLSRQEMRAGEVITAEVVRKALRLGLIENLARITTGLAQGRRDRDLANQWVERLQAMAEKHPSRIVIVVADMARADHTDPSYHLPHFYELWARWGPPAFEVGSCRHSRLASA